MSNEGKKISFSFSKVKKPNLINKSKVETTEKIDYVDCFDGSKGKFSYKGNTKNNEIEKQELVIPMPSTKTSLDILRSRIEEKLNSTKEESNRANSNDNQGDSEKSFDKEPPKNLEDLAALEILNEAKSNTNYEKKAGGLVIVTEKVEEASEANIDYDNIPVSDFGMALLRGMGWKPGTGIGKEPRLVGTVSPKLRPKRLGLGAKINPEVNEEKATEKEKKRTENM